jgi:hypothetical protein
MQRLWNREWPHEKRSWAHQGAPHLWSNIRRQACLGFYRLPVVKSLGNLASVA